MHVVRPFWHRVLGRAVVLLACIAAGPATKPATAPADAALWERLADIDSRAGRITTLTADFEQRKFTALLRKPLVSTGRVRIKGPVMRWDTENPEPSVLLIDPHEARVYYPSQKVLEIYPLDKRLADLASSPLPRLAVLKDRFSFERLPEFESGQPLDVTRYLALRLTPTDPALIAHVKQVRVLLDVRSAYIVAAEVTDSDDDRTLLSFRDVQLDREVGELGLSVPAGVTITHPLEGLNGQSPQSQGASK